MREKAMQGRARAREDIHLHSDGAIFEGARHNLTISTTTQGAIVMDLRGRRGKIRHAKSKGSERE